MAHYRYPEDPTGKNPDNLVSGEEIPLTDRAIRVALPRFRPLYVDSLVLYDAQTTRLLQKGTDYRVPFLLQEATLRYGQEVGDAILIENPEVSNKIYATYQTVGGAIQNNIDNIVDIFELFLKDNRSIDWVTGVFGKPSTFPAAPHPHFLSEIFGFEPLAFELERIAQAIGMGAAPAFEELYRTLERRIATTAEIQEGRPLPKFLTLEGLITALQEYNFNSIKLTPMNAKIRNGGSLWFTVDASYVPKEKTLIWTIEHGTTNKDDFVANSGLVTLTKGSGAFGIQATLDPLREEEETFTVVLRKTALDGTIIARTWELTATSHGAFGENDILDASVAVSYTPPQLRINATTYAVHQALRSASQS